MMIYFILKKTSRRASWYVIGQFVHLAIGLMLFPTVTMNSDL